LTGVSFGSASPLLPLPLAIKPERIKDDVPPSTKILAATFVVMLLRGLILACSLFAATFGRLECRWEGRLEGCP
jgi:hypothetical protein